MTWSVQNAVLLHYVWEWRAANSQQRTAAHSSARSAQCAVAHSIASAKRRANKKAKGAPVSISYML
jgi:hypothetical protein